MKWKPYYSLKKARDGYFFLFFSREKQQAPAENGKRARNTIYSVIIVLPLNISTRRTVCFVTYFSNSYRRISGRRIKKKYRLITNTYTN